jgi:hypothetical protein
LDAGKTPGWAGATPVLAAFGWPTLRGVAPAPQTGKLSVCEVFCPRPVKTKKEKRRKHMSIINKPPQHVKREYELEEPVALVVEKYATFIDSTPDHVVNSALKMLLWKDKHFMNWRKQQQQAARKDTPATAAQKSQVKA